MEKRNNILKDAVVILIVTVLLSTMVSANTFKDKDEKIGETLNGRRVVFWNYPYQESSVDFRFLPSSEDWENYCADIIFGFNEVVTKVKWWGISKDSTSQPCDPTGMIFHLFFFENDQGVPGDTTAAYTSIVPDVYDTNRIYDDHYPLWEFSYDLNPGVALSNHWIVLLSAGSPYGAIFFWSNAWGTRDALMYPPGSPIDDSLAFELSKDYPTEPVSKLKDCDYIEWRGSTANENVFDVIELRNDGEAGSILDWEITEWPNWGTDWSIHPMDGTYLLISDIQDIYVQVKAPMTFGKELHGKIKIINLRDPPDYIEIDVVISTPRTKAQIFPLIATILQRFPILQRYWDF